MSLHHMLRAAVQQQAGGPSDPYFEYNTLLLTGDGTNGAQNNTFLDSSTNNFTITRNGNTTQGSFSPYGPNWSNYFDGTGNSLTFTATSAMSFAGDMTVEAWVYLTSYAGSSYNECTLLSLRTGSATGSQFDWGRTGGALAAGAIEWWNYGASVLQGSGGDIPLNQWAHVAYVRSGSGTNNCKAYVNGVLKAQGTYTGTVGVSSGTCYIGNSMYNQPMNGYASNLRVTSTAVYTSNFTPSTTPLTAVSGTSLLTCQSNRFIDNSSNNFTLTVNGNTSVQRFSPFNPTAPYSTATIGGSGYFDGTGDYLTYLTPNASVRDWWVTNWTCEAWVYPTTLNGWSDNVSGIRPTLVGNMQPTGDGDYWSFGPTTTGEVRIIYYTGTGVQVGSGLYVKAGQWNHVAFTRTSSGIQFFVNGVGSSVTSTGTSLSSSTLPLTIGSHRAASINGYVCDLRILYGTALYSGSSYTVPSTPLTSISNTSFLANMTNAGIPDAAMMNDLETVGNAQVSTSVKKYGTGSLAFDGTGDWLMFPATPNLYFGTGDFTIEFWMYQTSSTGAQYLISQAAGTFATSQFDVNINSGNISGTVYYGSSYVATTSTAITLNTWTHIAFVRNGSGLVLYKNGVSSGTGTISTNALNSPTGEVRVGALNNATPYAYIGYIDDLRITKGYARYTTNFTPPTAALPTY